METSAFNINRFGLLVKNDMLLNGSKYLIQLLFTTLSLVLFIIIFSKTESYSYENITKSSHIFYIISLFLFMILFNFGLFNFYGNQIKTENYITIPVSILEKYIYPIVKTISFYILYTIIFIIVYSIIMKINFNKIDYIELFSNTINIYRIKYYTILPLLIFFPVIKLSHLITKRFKIITSIILYSSMMSIVSRIQSYFSDKSTQVFFENSSDENNSLVIEAKNNADFVHQITENPLFTLTIIIVFEILIYVRLKKIQA